jgi:carbonic anhydrase
MLSVRTLPLALPCLLLASTAWAEKPVDLKAEIAQAIKEARQETQGHGAVAAVANPAPKAHATPKAHAPAAHGGGGGHGDASEGPDPEVVWTQMMQGNLRFVAGKPRTRETIQLRRNLAKGQKPKAIILSCSDSRVPPELLFDQNLGDVFVVRTAGNVADAVAIGSIEYAVEHLHARLLVVLGHEECGAVAAAASGAKMPSPHLEAVVEQIQPAIAELKVCGSSPPSRRIRVEANVAHSMETIVKNSAIIRDAISGGELGTITAVYGLESGVVTRLEDQDH